MIDVDDFKRFNDTYGHVAGDAALGAIARAIGSAVGRPRDLVARFGGEEFAVILSGTAAEAGRTLAERIRANVAAARIPHRTNRAASIVTISLGVAQGAPDDPSATAVIERADAALYEAKSGGRNRVCVRSAPAALIPTT
jgi:diguanylate cyclase (GGDEF)-like protein